MRTLDMRSASYRIRLHSERIRLTAPGNPLCSNRVVFGSVFGSSAVENCVRSSKQGTLARLRPEKGVVIFYLFPVASTTPTIRHTARPSGMTFEWRGR